jgi:hypothetical protein
LDLAVLCTHTINTFRTEKYSRILTLNIYLKRNTFVYKGIYTYNLYSAPPEFDAQMLETLWLKQDKDSQDFIHSLQQMKNKINKICVNQMVQTDIQKFFNRSKVIFAVLYVAINVL